MKNTKYDIIGVQKDVIWRTKDAEAGNFQKGIDELTHKDVIAI